MKRFPTFGTRKQKLIAALVLGLFGVLVYVFFFTSLTFNPLTERQLHEQLENTKQTHELAPFVSDGCSGGVSAGWTRGVQQFSEISSSFEASYGEIAVIPFEAACIAHDAAYHTGEGGYIGRLRADNALRTAILTYAMENYAEIQTRTGITTPEQVLYLYELIAEAVYRGVRLGGAPCTGETYAWGYGYNEGRCIE